jgi:hypothetical protein
MWKLISAGLMCFGLATLSVAAFGAQSDDTDGDGAVVIEGKPEGTPVPATPAGSAAQSKKEDAPAVVEIRIGEDGNATYVNRVKDADAGDEVEVTIQDDSGRTVRKIRANPNAVRATARFRLASPAIDAETRQALEKMIAGLHDEIKILQADKKDEEAEKKVQSARALRQLLVPVPQPGGVRFYARTPENLQPDARLQELHARRQELQAQAAKLGEGDHEAREKLQKARADLERGIAQRQQVIVAAGSHANPWVHSMMGGPVPPGMPAPGQPMHWPQPGGNVAFGPYGVAVHSHPAADELSRKAMALSQAAAKLKEAGLDKQAQELNDQAQKLNAEADKIREQAAFHGFAAGGGFGPPAELRHAIHELQEQIQELRKEVGELRELLQRRQ